MNRNKNGNGKVNTYAMKNLNLLVLVLAVALSCCTRGAAAAAVNSPWPQLGLPGVLPGLDYTFYDDTCPEAEGIIRERVNYMVKKNVSNAARLLRLWYQDCFVSGCDASILLADSSGGPADAAAGKISAPAADAFAIIDDIKAELEQRCPAVVSCADIVALAARDSILATKGPYFPIPTGRRDGRKADTAEEVETSLAKATWNVSQLLHHFKSKGLDVMDLVALSGAHTIGMAHCSSLADRLSRPDPHMSKKLIEKLALVCPTPYSTNSTELDFRSPHKFDNKYYKNLVDNEGLLTSDQNLYYDARTREIVRNFRGSKRLFFMEFWLSAIKMGQMGVLTGSHGEIRHRCSMANYIPAPTPAPASSPSPCEDDDDVIAVPPPSPAPSHSSSSPSSSPPASAPYLFPDSGPVSAEFLESSGNSRVVGGAQDASFSDW